MAYDNLTNIATSKSGTWTGASFSYSTIPLESGVPHKDQLEVERIFNLPTSPDVASQITVFDLHRIFIVNKDDYTVNESNSTITALTPSNPTTRTYTLTGGALSGTVVTIPVITNGQAIVVRRKTFSSGKYVTWSAGTRLTSEQLNLQVNQLIKLNQELIYKLESEYLRSSDVVGSSAPAFGINNSLDMQGNKILNLGLAASGTDAVSVNYGNANYLQIGGSVAQSVTGAKTFSGAAVFQNTVTANSSLLVTGATTLNGGLTMDGGVFSVADTTGNTGIGGTLNVTGATVLSSTLSAGATTLASAGVTGALTAGSLAVDTTTLFVNAANNRVGIGTNSPNADLHVKKTSGAAEILSASSDTTSSAGVYAMGSTASIDIASYGSAATNFLFGRSRASLTRVYSVNSSGLVVGTADAQPLILGTDNTTRLTIPSNAAGIQFPDPAVLSGNAFTLDAYEEGTHTILNTHISGSGGAYTSVTLDNTTAALNKVKYTRIGNFILFNCVIKISAITVGSGSGPLTISSLPWTGAEAIGIAANVFPVYFDNLTPATFTNVLAYAGGSSFRFAYRTTGAAGLSNLEGVHLQAGSYLSFSGTVRL